MADSDTFSVLQRKAGAGQPPSGLPPLSAAGALGNALLRAGQNVAGISIAMQAAEEGKAVLDDVLGDLPEHALLCLVEGPESSFGMVVMDRSLVAGLVEAQTIGNVSSSPVAERTPTRTDAAICADLIDRLLECFEAESLDAKLAIAPHISGYRYAFPMMDPQVIPLTLENIFYRTFKADLDLANGAKQGVLTIILPFENPAESKRSHSCDGGTSDQTIAEVAMTCRAELRAILHRVLFPVTEVSKFEVGMMIPIPLKAMGEVELLDPEDGVVTTCRLGRMHDQRALRIGPASDLADSPIAPEQVTMGSATPANEPPPLPSASADIPTP